MSQANPFRILSLQPFHTGSHRQFIDSWIAHSSLSWDCLNLPGRHWKWRMRHAAVHLAEEVDRLFADGNTWDVIVCTDMLNLAEFRGLLKTGARDIPTLVYFHENQFEYPDLQNRERDLHFAFTNFTSALAADMIWFNSEFNRHSMLRHLNDLSSKWPDYPPVQQIEEFAKRASVQPPGVDIVASTINRPVSPPHIVWAARWEHDKNPKLLLEILRQLRNHQVDFQLSVVGQKYSIVPGEFEIIEEEFENEIRHWGYQVDRSQYLQVLAEADVCLSTASHEFFGISVVESVCAGCLPLLPNRLVYPELLRIKDVPERSAFLYDSVDAAVNFIANLTQTVYDSVRIELTDEFRNRYTWDSRAAEMDALIIEHLEGVANRVAPTSETTGLEI